MQHSGSIADTDQHVPFEECNPFRKPNGKDLVGLVKWINCAYRKDLVTWQQTKRLIS
jgi:hypothetical protein